MSVELRKFAKTEALINGQWGEIPFENLRPDQVMRTSNAPGKTFRVTSHPAKISGMAQNWAIRCVEVQF